MNKLIDLQDYNTFFNNPYPWYNNLNNPIKVPSYEIIINNYENQKFNNIYKNYTNKPIKILKIDLNN